MSLEREPAEERETSPDPLNVFESAATQRGLHFRLGPKRHLAAKTALLGQDLIRRETIRLLEVIVWETKGVLHSSRFGKNLLGDQEATAVDQTFMDPRQHRKLIGGAKELNGEKTENK